jgi:hypothetical protein
MENSVPSFGEVADMRSASDLQVGKQRRGAKMSSLLQALNIDEDRRDASGGFTRSGASTASCTTASVSRNTSGRTDVTVEDFPVFTVRS